MSDAFKVFAQRRLEGRKQATLERLIAQLSTSQQSSEKVTVLPTLLSDARRYADTVGVLSADHFQALVTTTESFSTVTTQADLGAQAAEQLNDNAAHYRFRLIQSLASEARRTESEHAEISALMAVGDVIGALNLARTASFKEDRLRLLASALAQAAEQGHELESGAVDELRQLCLSVDVDQLGETIVDIAGDVFAVAPAAALQLIERFGKASTKGNALDWIFAMLSVRHLVKGRHARTEDSTFSNLQERIADSRLRIVSESIGLVGSNSDPTWVLGHCRRLPSASDRLAIARMWLQLNGRRPDAAQVAAWAIDLAIETPEYALTVSVLRQLAMCLPYASDSTLTIALIDKFDAQVYATSLRSPSAEYVRLQLLLARAQAKHAPEAARLRTVELYLFIEGLEDLAVKAECLARLFAWLPILEPDKTSTDVRQHLSSLVDELLRHSAGHDDVLLPVLRPLVPNHAQLAFDLADRANTDVRRNELIAELAREYSKAPATEQSVAAIATQLAKVADVRRRGVALVLVLSELSKQAETGHHARQLWSAIKDLPLDEDKAQGFAYLARCLGPGEASTGALEEMQAALGRLQDPQRRAEVGFGLIREVAAIDKTLAVALLATLRGESSGEARSNTSGRGFALTIRLASRALAAVAATEAGFDVELARVLELTKRMPDTGERMTVLSELAFWLSKAGRTDLASKMHRELIQPNLDQAHAESQGQYWFCLALSGWLLYQQHDVAFWDAIKSVPPVERDRILGTTIRTLIQDVPPPEPCGTRPDYTRPLSYKVAMSVLALLEHSKDDGLMFWAIRAITRSATMADTEITREQRANLQEKAASLVERTLPVPNKIQHNGYKWACVAELNRMSDSRVEDWRELAAWAKQLPNVPDAAFTLSLVASAAPRKFQALRKEVIESAVQLARTIRVATERIDCLLSLGDQVWVTDNQLGKSLVKEAATILKGAESDDTESQERRTERLLDIAYRISPEFALAISVDLDSDPARSRAIRRKRIPFITLEARNQMLEGRVEFKTLDEGQGTILGRAAWKNLSALNATLLPPQAAKDMRRVLDEAAHWPLAVTFPAYAWYAQNLVDRGGPTRQKGVALRELAQANILAAELAPVFASGAQAAKDHSAVQPLHFTNRVVIAAGERSKALKVLGDWCNGRELPYLKIADQFFGPDDLDLLKVVLGAHPNCSVHILTSSKHMSQLQLQTPAEAFSHAWARISNMRHASIDVTIAGVPPHMRSPLHDRWWISAGAALDFGTSANSLGIGQESSIKLCDEGEARVLEQSVDRFLNRTTRRIESEVISYLTFSI